MKNLLLNCVTGCFFASTLMVPAFLASAEGQETKEKHAAVEHDEDARSEDVSAPPFLDFDVQTIEGEEVNLGDYAGKVVVVVNVASRCGYTRHYKNLQAIHEQYADQGLAVLGFPCNQFGGQEPGEDAEILEFCQSKFGVEFDMFSKVDVKGKKQADFFSKLTNEELQPVGKGDIRWNFEKFIFDRNGNPIARFPSKASPESEDFIKVIETALRQPVPEQFKSDETEEVEETDEAKEPAAEKEVDSDKEK